MNERTLAWMLGVLAALLVFLVIAPPVRATPSLRVDPTQTPVVDDQSIPPLPQNAVKPIGLATICALIAVIGASSLALVAALSIQKRMLAIAEEAERRGTKPPNQ